MLADPHAGEECLARRRVLLEYVTERELCVIPHDHVVHECRVVGVRDHHLNFDALPHVALTSSAQRARGRDRRA